MVPGVFFGVPSACRSSALPASAQVADDVPADRCFLLQNCPGYASPAGPSLSRPWALVFEAEQAVWPVARLAAELPRGPGGSGAAPVAVEQPSPSPVEPMVQLLELVPPV